MFRFFKELLESNVNTSADTFVPANTQTDTVLSQVLTDVTTERLATQFDFLNGNYAFLLRKDNGVGNQNKICIEEQIDFYLRRFFAKNCARALTVGGGFASGHSKDILSGLHPHIKHKGRAFWACPMYTDGTTVEQTVCLLYFVETLLELKRIHACTIKQIEKTHQFRGHIHPVPPIVIVTRDKTSELHDPKIIQKEIIAEPDSIPILSVFHLSDPQYKQYVTNGVPIERELDYPTWGRIMDYIKPIFFRLAVARGLIYKDVQNSDIEFRLCNNQLAGRSIMCRY